MLMNRKTATKLLLVQWSRFQNECIRLEGSTLFTGVNGTGKVWIKRTDRQDGNGKYTDPAVKI